MNKIFFNIFCRNLFIAGLIGIFSFAVYSYSFQTKSYLSSKTISSENDVSDSDEDESRGLDNDHFRLTPSLSFIPERFLSTSYFNSNNFRLDLVSKFYALPRSPPSSLVI